MKEVLLGFLALAVAGVIFLSFGGFRWIQSFLKISIHTTHEVPYITKKPPFHPRAVLGIRWKTLFDEKIYRREKALAPWQPAVKPKFIFQLLNELPLLEYRPGVAHTEPKLTLTFIFSNDAEWDLSWDGRMIWWESGNLEGYGLEVLNTPMNFLFLAGAHAFEDLSWNWCKKPVQKVVVERFEQEPFEIIGYELQKWLGQHCKIAIDSFLDDKMFKIDYQANAQLKIHFVDGEKTTVDANDSNHVFWWPTIEPPHTMFRSTDWSKAIFDQGASR